MLRRTTFGALVLTLLASGVPASAAEPASAAIEEPASGVPSETSAAAPGVTPESPSVERDADWSLAPVQFGGARRGSLLPALYVSLAGLNAFDAYSTSKGLGRGAAEANPLMRTVAGNPTMVWVVKAGVTGASVAMAERLWRKNKRAQAVAVMVISNGMMAAVAARNASVLRKQP
jgi:hypothetical protein